MQTCGQLKRMVLDLTSNSGAAVIVPSSLRPRYDIDIRPFLYKKYSPFRTSQRNPFSRSTACDRAQDRSSHYVVMYLKYELLHPQQHPRIINVFVCL